MHAGLQGCARLLMLEGEPNDLFRNRRASLSAGIKEHSSNISPSPPLTNVRAVPQGCARILLPEDERRTFLRRFRNPRVEVLQRKAMFKKVADRCKRQRYCPHCGDVNGEPEPRKVRPLLRLCLGYVWAMFRFCSGSVCQVLRLCGSLKQQVVLLEQR
jgi:hypothetical protein